MRNSNSVQLAGSADKRAITATFAQTLDDAFLPMQLIYKGKTSQSFPKIIFPTGFSLSANEKHFSNTEESIKFLEEIIVSYVDKKRGEIDSPDQAALLIWDVFRGQKTEPVLEVLRANNILTEYIPSNMTNYYQPLDCTTNKCVKEFMKSKFSAWYSDKFRKALRNGTALEDIEIKFPLTTMKPLHATWLIQLYNELTSEKGKNVIHGSWVKSGIFDAVMLGCKNLPSLDPFDEIEPLDTETITIDAPHGPLTGEYTNQEESFPSDDSDSEWELDDNNGRSAFDMFEE